MRQVTEQAVSKIISRLIFKMSVRSPKDSLLLIYPHNQVEIGGNSTFQILGKKFFD